VIAPSHNLPTGVNYSYSKANVKHRFWIKKERCEAE